MNLHYEMFGNKMTTKAVDLDDNQKVVATVRRKVNLVSNGVSSFKQDGYTYTAKLTNGKVRLGPCKSMTQMLERIRQAY